MKNTCPVCGYDNLRCPVADYSICPCCHTEFGVSDYSWSHDVLRRIWLERGANWGSKRVAEPPDWSPAEQLSNIGYKCTDADLINIAKSRNETGSSQTFFLSDKQYVI